MPAPFDNLFPVKDAPVISLELREKCVAFAEAVLRRVPGVKCLFNAVRRELFFFFIDPSAGPLAIPVWGEDAWALDQRDQDDSVAVLWLATEPLAKREQRRAEKEKQEANAREQERGVSREENRKDLWKLAERQRRQKRGLSSLTVDLSPTARYAETPGGLLVPRDAGVSK